MHLGSLGPNCDGLQFPIGANPDEAPVPQPPYRLHVVLAMSDRHPASHRAVSELFGHLESQFVPPSVRGRTCQQRVQLLHLSLSPDKELEGLSLKSGQSISVWEREVGL